MILSREVACSRALRPDGGEILIGRWTVYGIYFPFLETLLLLLDMPRGVMWLL